MKKILIWTTIGLGLAIISGLVGMPHLSASMATLTAFFAAPAILILALDILPHAVRERA